MRDGDGRLLRTFNRGSARIAGLPRGPRLPARGAPDALRGDASRSAGSRGRASSATRCSSASPTASAAASSSAADDGERLIARRKDLEDHPIPSGSSSAALGLLRLAALTGESRYEDAAVAAIRLAPSSRRAIRVAFGHLLCALDFHTATVREVALVGEPLACLARRRARALPAAPRARRSARHRGSAVPLLEGRAALRRSAGCLRLRALRLPGAGQRAGGAARRCSIEHLQLSLAEDDVRSREVLLEMVDLRGARGSARSPASARGARRARSGRWSRRGRSRSRPARRLEPLA